MEAKDTVLKERGSDYDANCGQMIACDILPKYIKDSVVSCYTELSEIIEGFVESERREQAEITWPVAEKEGMRKVVEWIKETGTYWIYKDSERLQAKLEEWGIDKS